MQDGFFSLNSRPYAEIPRRPKAYKATILQFCNTWPTYPKLARAYTVRTGLFECPAVLLFAPCTEHKPIDDDAENAGIRLPEACIPLSI